MASAATKTGNILGPRSSGIVTTDATTGKATVAFPAGLFSAPPVVLCSGVSSDGRDVVVTIFGDPTATSVTFLARKSRIITGTLLASQPFDPFAPAAVKVHYRAAPAPPGS